MPTKRIEKGRILPSGLFDDHAAADYIGQKPATLRKWACIDPDKLPFVKIGRCRFYEKNTLDWFIRRNVVGAVESHR